MPYTLTAKYGTTTLFSDIDIGTSASITYNGSTIATIDSAGTKTLNCANLLMKTNVVVGGKTLNCANMVMSDNVVLTSAVYQKYLIKEGSSSVSWTDQQKFYDSSKTTSNGSKYNPTRSSTSGYYSFYMKSSSGKYGSGASYCTVTNTDKQYKKLYVDLNREIGKDPCKISVGLYDNDTNYINSSYAKANTYGPIDAGAWEGRKTISFDISSYSSVKFCVGMQNYNDRNCTCRIYNMWLE